MRFYIGFSKRINIKTIIQLLGFLFVALCAFFGIDKLTAHAATISINPNGYSVNAYRPLYSNETGGTCSRFNSTGCSDNSNIYNATGCNNYTSGGITYCMFRNNNSTSYFSLKSMTCDSNNVCYAEANSTFGTNTTYRPHSKLVWTWQQSNVNYCTSGNLTLYFKFLVTTNNTVLNDSNRCAFDLNTVTGSIGYCSMFVTVNGSSYSPVSQGNGTYSVVIPKPTTNLTFTIPDIQPFLKETAGEGGTFSDKLWNYGIAITGYDCSESSSNIDTNTIVNNATQNTQNIINSITQSTLEINDNIQGLGEQIADSASDILDSLEELKDNQDENTQELIDSQNTCIFIDKSNISINGSYLNSDNSSTRNSSFGITSYFRITSTSSLIPLSVRGGSANLCFYNINKELISCIPNSSMVLNEKIVIPSLSAYFRGSIRIDENKPTFQLCRNGNQAIYDSINDDSVSPGGFGINFPTYPTEIQTLIGMPINLISTVINYANNGTCTALSFDLSSITQRWGGTNYVLQVPCMKPKLQTLLGDYYGLFDIIMAALLFYFVACNIVGLVLKYISMEDLFPHYFETSRSSSFVKEEVYKE